MKGLSPEQTSRYLSALAEIKRSCRIYDTHAHPYEILFDRFSYLQDPAAAGVLSVPGRSYAAPARAHFAFPEIAEFDSAEAQRLFNYQRHTFDDIVREIAACLGWKKYFVPLARPLARRMILKMSKYYAKSAAA